MKRKAPRQVSEIRQAQRAHAKRRFQQRFNLTLNRDRIHELEKKIASGQAVPIENRPRTRNYLVAESGQLIAVGYDTATHRIKTALPDEYLERVPPDVIARAKFKLLKAEQDRILSTALEGQIRITHQLGSLMFGQVESDGVTLNVGVNVETGKLVPYRSRRALKKPRSPDSELKDIPLVVSAPAFVLLELDPEVAEDFRRQIHEGTSTFLWRRSNTITYHRLDRNGELQRLGFSRTRNAFCPYEDPPDATAELRSSLELLSQSADVLASICDLITAGRGELLIPRGGLSGSYRVEHDGRTYWCDYFERRGRLGPWNGGRMDLAASLPRGEHGATPS